MDSIFSVCHYSPSHLYQHQGVSLAVGLHPVAGLPEEPDWRGRLRSNTPCFRYQES